MDNHVASTSAVDPVPVKLVTTAWGSRDADRRALLVHGLGSTAAEWWRVAEALARDGYRVVAPDLRGHGDSPATAGYRVDELVSDLHELGADPDLGAFVPTELGRYLAATNPLITYEVATGSGHTVYRDDPAAVVAAALAPGDHPRS